MPRLCSKNEVIRYYREFVQDQHVRRVLSRNLSEEKVGRRILEGIGFRSTGALVRLRGACWFLRKSWTIANLILDSERGGKVSKLESERACVCVCVCVARRWSGLVTGMFDVWTVARCVEEKIK